MDNTVYEAKKPQPTTDRKAGVPYLRRTTSARFLSNIFKQQYSPVFEIMNGIWLKREDKPRPSSETDKALLGNSP